MDVKVGSLGVAPVAIISFIILYFIHTVTRTETSDLAKVPGPWFARIFYIDYMHKKYGAVMLISPNEVSFTSPEVFNEVYKIVVSLASEAAQKIKMEAEYGTADIFKWFTLMNTDIIGEIAFGEPFNMVKTGEVSIVSILSHPNGLRPELPRLFDSLKAVDLFSELDDQNKRVFAYGHKVLENANNRELRDNLGKSNIFKGVLEDAEKDGSIWSDERLSIEASGLVIAGSGTTAVTATYLVWAVLKNESIQDRLEAEVADLTRGWRDSDLERLPFLNAVIQEALRLYSAAPGNLPREVPKDRPLSIDGHVIFPGTTVSSQAYTMHRDPAVFNFKTPLRLKLADSMNDDVMAMVNFFLISPKGHRMGVTMRRQ
ncbi:cytochrome P450 [Rhexocercosporidium sp. MPI-PUGE-AT-0058]|nr:cytochrome P450 [Rhexocercosporidium sp. MPI-PUGE-AT-0058]